MEISEAELQAKIDAAVTSAVDGLKTKRDELLGKIDKYKADIEVAEKAKADELEAERQAKLSAEGKHEEVLNSVKANLQKTIDTLTDRLTAAETEAKKATGDLRTLLVDKGLSAAFLEAGVTNKDLLEAAVTLNSSKAEIVDDEEGNPVVKIDGLDMDTFTKDWTVGKGKAFISDGRSGGGAGGSGGGGGTDDYEQFFKPETKNMTKQQELKKVDPDRYTALDKKYNAQGKLPLSATVRR